MTRLETLSDELTEHFRSADGIQRQKLVSEALRMALESNQIHLHIPLGQLLTGNVADDQLAELGQSCKMESEQSDELYFDHEEAGDPEAVWSTFFRRARAYAAVAEFCESRNPQLEEVLYEAMQSQGDPDSLISPFIGLLGA